MKSDADIRRDVDSELNWEPSVDGKRIGVAVSNGVVTLTGDVPHYFARWAAEESVKRVKGVRAIANDIEIKILVSGARILIPISPRQQRSALRWNVSLSGTEIDATGGERRLRVAERTGELGLSANRCRERRATSDGRESRFEPYQECEPSVKISDVKQKIEEAFRRHAMLDAKDIQVVVHNASVTLNGHVHSWREREDAHACRRGRLPGVNAVENHLAVQ